MAYTQEIQTRIDYLRNSVRLQDPAIEADPAYKFTDDDLYAILSVVTPTHNSTYTIETLPTSEFHFINLLGKKEIYYRLATSTAPFYPLSAEGASLQKNVRFDHYMKLLEQTDRDYSSAVSMWESRYFGEATTLELTTNGRHYSQRNVNLANKPTVELFLSSITSNSVNIDWTKFASGLFSCYKLFVDTTPIVDEYGETAIRGDIQAKFFTSDIHKLKIRVTDLVPDTDYYVCIASVDRNGLYGYAEQSFRTLPLQ